MSFSWLKSGSRTLRFTDIFDVRLKLVKSLLHWWYPDHFTIYPFPLAYYLLEKIELINLVQIMYLPVIILSIYYNDCIYRVDGTRRVLEIITNNVALSVFWVPASNITLMGQL